MTDAIVKCPTCSKAVAWISSSKFRPFCSERCHMIDLGAWAEEKHRIPSDPEHDDATAGDLDQD